MKKQLAGMVLVVSFLLSACGGSSSNPAGQYAGRMFGGTNAGPVSIKVYGAQDNLLGTLGLGNSSYSGLCDAAGAYLECAFRNNAELITFKGNLRGSEWSGTWAYGNGVESYSGSFTVSRL